jgi:hypothetical protein
MAKATGPKFVQIQVVTKRARDKDGVENDEVVLFALGADGKVYQWVMPAGEWWSIPHV